MSRGRRVLHWARASLVLMAAIGVALVLGRPARTAADFSGHGAVGSYFGKAIQLCPTGVGPAACSVAGPALALYMTPTLAADGMFFGDDSFAVGTPPFGPHTAAHGQWFPTSPTEFVADYTFLLNTFPPIKSTVSITALRFRWAGTVVDRNTLQGYVNMYLLSGNTPTWTELLGDQFPVLTPSESTVLTPPSSFVKDPSLCRTSGCPLVFKFTVKRVAPTL